MALEPPKAKKLAYWRRMDEVVIWAIERLRDWRLWWMVVRSRNRGMLVARDWVMASRV